MKSIFSYLKIIIFYLLTLIIFIGSSAITKQSPLPDLLTMIVASILTFILIYGFVRIDKSSLSQNGLGYDKKSMIRFASGFGIGVGMVLVMSSIVTIFSQVSFVQSQTFQSHTFAVYIPLFLFIALREELVFRTYMLWKLKANTGAMLALVIVTVIFIIEHLVGGYSLVDALLGSGLGAVLFCFATLRTGNIALSIGLHFAWNLTHWLFGFKGNTGFFIETVHKGSEQQAEIVAFMAYSIAMLLGIAIVYLFFKPKNKKLT